MSVGTGNPAHVIGTESVVCMTTVRGKTSAVRFTGVLCVPTLVVNLISVITMGRSKPNTTFDSDSNGENMRKVAARDGEVEYLHGIESTTTGLYEAVLKPNSKFL